MCDFDSYAVVNNHLPDYRNAAVSMIERRLSHGFKAGSNDDITIRVAERRQVKSDDDNDFIHDSDGAISSRYRDPVSVPEPRRRRNDTIPTTLP